MLLNKIKTLFHKISTWTWTWKYVKAKNKSFFSFWNNSFQVCIIKILSSNWIYLHYRLHKYQIWSLNCNIYFHSTPFCLLDGTSFFCLQQQILSLINWNSVPICPISPCKTKFLKKPEQKQIAKFCKFHGSNFSNYNFCRLCKRPQLSGEYCGNIVSDKYCEKIGQILLGMVGRTNIVENLEW